MAPDPSRKDTPVPLDEHETAILRLLAQGLDTSEIAQRLGRSEGSVRRVLAQTMERLQLTSRWQAVAYAFRADLI